MSKDTLAQLLPHIIELKEAVARTEQKIEGFSNFPERLSALEVEIRSFKALASHAKRIVAAVALGIGSVIAWAADLLGKVKHAIN